MPTRMRTRTSAKGPWWAWHRIAAPPFDVQARRLRLAEEVQVKLVAAGQRKGDVRMK